MDLVSLLNNKRILITGGTGGLGKKLVERLLKLSPDKIIIYSRDEYKQHLMAQEFSHGPMRYFIGDIRDKDRLKRVLKGVHYVIHTAALKQVPAMEYNPSEAVATNIQGAENLIEACLDTEVERLVNISTDKAVEPINLYGATKQVAEKLFVAADAYRGTLFASCRYGNVWGSRGSVVPFFKKLAYQGLPIPLTNRQMTRFWLTFDQAVDLVMFTLSKMKGGEIIVPAIPSCSMIAVAQALAPDNPTAEIGIRPGEKLHETLLSINESRHTVDAKDKYVILPAFNRRDKIWDVFPPVQEDFFLTSLNNPNKLDKTKLQAMDG